MATSTKTRKVSTLATISETMRANLTKAPTATELTTEAPTATELTTEAPTATELTTEAPTATELATEAPTATKLATEAPTATELTTEAPTATELTTEAPTATELTTEAPAAPALYATDAGGHIQHNGVHIGYMGTTSNPDALIVVSKTGKTTIRHTALGQSFAPKTLLVAVAYEKTRKLCLNGRYKEFFADVSRLMSTQDKAVLFNNPTALSAFSSEPNKAGALALLRFCISRWTGVKNAEKVAFASLCAEILAALTK